MKYVLHSGPYRKVNVYSLHWFLWYSYNVLHVYASANWDSVFINDAIVINHSAGMINIGGRRESCSIVNVGGGREGL